MASSCMSRLHGRALIHLDDLVPQNSVAVGHRTLLKWLPWRLGFSGCFGSDVLSSANCSHYRPRGCATSVFRFTYTS